MEKLRRNLNSDKEEDSRSNAVEGKTSSAETVGPTIDDNRTCRWTAENSLGASPLTVSTVRKKFNLLPGGKAPGIGEADPLECPFDGLEGRTTLTNFISTRQEPIASAVYRQNIGTVEVQDNLRETGANEIRALPMKEYSGGGES